MAQKPNHTENFFDRLKKLGRDLDSGTKDLEGLLEACKTRDKDVLSKEAESVLKGVAAEINDLQKSCSNILNEFREECDSLSETVNNASSVILKQKELNLFYSHELSKYGYAAEANKENIPETEENSAQHIKSGLTSVAYYEKDSMPCDFQQKGLLVTPGLFPDQSSGYFNSPDSDKNDETFVIKPGEENTVEQKVDPPAEPSVISTIDVCNMKIPEEPVLLSRQPRMNSRALPKEPDIPKFDPLDPMTPLPPEPAIISQRFDRNIAHGIKRMDLDDMSDEEEVSPNPTMPKEPLYHSHSAKKNPIPPEPKCSSKTPNKIICGIEMPDTPELMSVKFYPSAKLLATIRQEHEQEKAKETDVTITESTEMEVKPEVENDRFKAGDEMKIPTPPVVHEPLKCPEPEPLADPKPALDATNLVIPPSPHLLSKPTGGRTIPKPNFRQPRPENRDGQIADPEPANPRHRDPARHFSIPLVSTGEYERLPDSLQTVVSVERMNRCVSNINQLLQGKCEPILTLTEIRDELGFGKHAKDVIVFLLKLGRIEIYKRCSKNPSYRLV